jgi:hypothetical protein
MPDEPAAKKFPDNWPDFAKPEHLKQVIDAAWPKRPATSSSGTYDVIIQIEGTNPISGYGVTIRPS